MRAVKSQYFLNFAVQGCLMPYTSVLFARLGLSNAEIGWVLGASSVAVMVAPIVLTWVADAHLDARRMLVVAFALSAAALAGLSAAHGFVAVLVLWGLYSLVAMPIMPLQDGISFVEQQRRTERGEPVEAYHRIRVWGTIGFMLPTLVLFFVLRQQRSMTSVVIAAALISVVGACNALNLPRDERVRHALDDPRQRRAPTMAALRAMLEPHVLVYCIAMFLVWLAVGAYYGFYPMYVYQRVGIAQQWLGAIANLGQVVEICFMLGFGWLSAKLGLKRLVVIGVLAIALRQFLLAGVPTKTMAVATQAFHGLNVLVITVIPAVFLNAHANDDCRHSIQGLYTVLIPGLARLVGSLIAGYIAERSLTLVFWWAGGLLMVAAALFVIAFHERAPQTVPVAAEAAET